MDLTAYIRDARARMRRHGVFLQAVTASAPFDRPYIYTVGLQRLPDPHPEVIVFACCLACSRDILSIVHRFLREGGMLPMGESTDLLAPDARIRVETVLPQWTAAYAGGVFSILERDHGEVPMVQLVLPDERGRWPDEQQVDPSPLGHQPLLSRAHPWLQPITHDADVDLFAEPGAPVGPLLAVPVLTPYGYDGRHELLRVEPVSDGRAIIAEVPWVADHVAVDALVEVRPLGGVPGCDQAIGRMGGMLTAGFETRAYRLPEAASVELGDVLWRWHGTDHTMVSTTTSTLHVNTAVPAAFDRAMRPFLRDGVLAPQPLQSVAEPLLPDIAECPDCG